AGLPWTLDGPATPLQRAVQLGARVALVSSPQADYVVRHSDRDETRIEVLAGSVTVRLSPGADPHELRVAARGVLAVARGTTYTVTQPAGDPPRVFVHEGVVDVRTPDRVQSV